MVPEARAPHFPGIFVEVAKADVKGSAAPAFHSVVAGLVDLVEDGLVDVIGQAGGNQGLVRVAENRLHKLDFFHEYTSGDIRGGRRPAACFILFSDVRKRHRKTGML